MEIYSANHAETVEELFEWPWRRFERFYEAFLKRDIKETLEQRKNQMISALWSNSNYDDDKGTRQKAIAEIEANFDQAIASIERGGQRDDDEEEIPEDNPFFASTVKAIDRIVKAVPMPTDNEERPVKDVIRNG